ncbi:SdpI family protein [Maricaulis sp.]|uniref:SdpI family protein n=1 Tax=Maricaulis sp. TaxID=1486257 RepID=UPI00260ED023|nr:SdpI family protein [Maricaulis sp.]
MIRKGMIFTIPLVLAMFAMSAYGWFNVEPGTQLPVHWGVDGQPDRYGSRFEAFLIMPLFMAGVLVLMAILPFIDPRGRNLQRSRPAYLTVWVGTYVFITAVHAVVVMASLELLPNGGADIMPQLVVAGSGLLMMLIGNVLGKARPNWFLGIRTPWTLSSDRAWDRTHRLTGRLMVLGGAVMVVAIFMLPPQLGFIVVAAGALIPAVTGVIYSYFAWRDDPERETASPEEVE